VDLDTQLFLALFVAPAVLGACVGYFIGLRPDKTLDTSWRQEPTVGTNYRTSSDIDYLGRREPTFNADTTIPTLGDQNV
jgi:hypothetical protein